MGTALDALRDMAVFVAVTLSAMAAGGMMFFGVAYFIDCFQDSRNHKKGKCIKQSASTKSPGGALLSPRKTDSGR